MSADRLLGVLNLSESVKKVKKKKRITESTRNEDYNAKTLRPTMPDLLPKTIKTDSKRAIRKTAEATSDLSGNRTTDRIANLSKKSSQNDEADNEMEIPK